jgi:decaprenyl-phosphate phosphoribosyltransferase
VRPAKPTLLATLLTVSDGTSIARAEPGPASGSSVVRELVRATRPRQWSKNLLVFAAPLLSGRFTESGVLADAAVAFVAFTLAASGVYLVNDVRDVESDRAHPTKRLRPVAAGSLDARTAAWAGGALAAAALVVALLAGVDLVVVVAIYLTLSLLYCFVLKDEPVIDIAIIAAGFLLRAIAGGAAAGIELSQWFLLAASFGSLFMAAGKRYAEILLVAQGEPALRASLASYSPSYLRFVWTVSAGLLIMTYGLWAFVLGEMAGGNWWYVASMAPFVLAVLRYALDVDRGTAEEPEELALRDRMLEVFALCWLVMVAVAVYST